MDTRKTATKDFVEALMLYVTAMNELNKQYTQALSDINEMFNRRIEGIKINEDCNAPLQ